MATALHRLPDRTPSCAPRPSFRRRHYSSLLGAALCALLAGCNGQPAATAADEARAARLRPSNTALAQQYERSCMVCHTQLAAQAPLAGFAPHWQPRLRQGMDTLVQHARDGMGAMPAGGQCADCTPADLRALIAFMAQDR